MPVTAENLRFILGLKLRTLRQERGASLKEVSNASGLSVSYLSEIEKGKKYPKPDKLIDLAGALGVTYEDLVSLNVADELDPLKEVFSSTFIQEFPFEVFGLEPQDVFALVADEPTRSGALIRTFLEIGRTYDMQVEHFLFAALRSYQQMHGNYFPDLEDLARDFRASQDWSGAAPISDDDLRGVLESEYGYRIDLDTLRDHPDLSDFRSVFVDGDTPTLLVNADLMPSQRAFVYGREIGYNLLGADERARTSSWLEVESYDQVLNNFKASYFSGAVLIDRDTLLGELRELFDRSAWDPEAFVGCMETFNSTPEMFFYRLTELVPHFFGLDDFFFLRFHNEAGSHDFELTKLLNMSQVPVPHGIGLREHYCHRWPAIQLLKDLNPSLPGGDGMPSDVTGGNGTPNLAATMDDDGSSDGIPMPVQVRAQRSRYVGDDAEFFVLSAARPLALQSASNSCVSIGFLLNDAFREHVNFWNDAAVERRDVNLTCERCPLGPDACSERVAPPTIYEREQSAKAKKEALAELEASLTS